MSLSVSDARHHQGACACPWFETALGPPHHEVGNWCHCPRFTVEGEAQGLFRRAEKGAGFVGAFALFAGRIGSSTIPAPAWTCIWPSFTTAVRSTMQVSISPSAPK